MLQDLRLAVRLIFREPRFSAVAIGALALGIGANATVFALADAVLMRGKPFKDPAALYTVSWRTTRGDRNLSYADLEAWRKEADVFGGLAGWFNVNMSVSDARGLPVEVHGTYVTANAFAVVGEQPLLGRNFGPADEQPDAEQAIILGHRIWTDRYGADPGVIGNATRVNGRHAVIVGVMRDRMHFPQNADLWAVVKPSDLQGRTSPLLNVGGRLRTGVTRREAETEVRAVGERLARGDLGRSSEVQQATLLTFDERFSGGPIRAAFVSMMGAVACLLLIACANVANLFVARSAARARELSVRMALGATRGRVIRQLLTESTVLGLAAGALGILLAAAGVRAFDAATVDTGKPAWIVFAIDWRAAGYLAAICLSTGALFGIAPALHVSSTAVAGSLKEAGRGTAGGRRVRWLTSAMVVTQMALAIVLLVAAGLMIRSLLNVHAVDIGIRTDGLSSVQLQLAGERYRDEAARRGFYAELERRLAAIPGVAGAALTTSVPPSGSDRRAFEIATAPERRDARARVSVVAIGPSFFEVVGAPLLRGRAFTTTDGTPGLETVIVDERMAAEHFPGSDAVGQRIRILEDPAADGQPAAAPVWRTIVGICPAIRHSSPHERAPAPVVYVPYRQEAPGYAFVLARSALPPASVMRAVRDEVQKLDPDQPVFNLRTMDQVLSRAAWPYRVFGSLFAIFGLIGLLLAAVGLYAVMTYSVAQRTREIGIRMALGARRGRILRLVLRRGLVELALGLAIGLGAASVLSAALQTLIVQVAPTDPLTFVATALLLVTVGIAACAIPACRASRIDPLAAISVK